MRLREQEKLLKSQLQAQELVLHGLQQQNQLVDRHTSTPDQSQDAQHPGQRINTDKNTCENWAQDDLLSVCVCQIALSSSIPAPNRAVSTESDPRAAPLQSLSTVT